ncbi:MAG: OmpA family protein [Candidatus Phaeomarinobacter sp.]
MTNTSFSTVSTSSASPRRGLRAGPLVAAAAALMLAACSTLPDWTKPSTASDAITGQAPSEPTNETVAAQQARAEANSENSNFPSAGSVPEVPEAGNAATKRDLTNSLVADRQHARYSGEALRGGTEPPASPLPSRRVAPLPDIPDVASASAPATTVPSQNGVIAARGIPEFEAPSARMARLEDGEMVETPVAAAPARPAVSSTATQPVEVATLPATTPAAAPAAATPVASAPVVATPAPVRQATAAPARRAAVPARSVPTFEAETNAAASRAVAAAPRAVAAPVNTSGQPQFAVSTAPPLPAEVRDQVPAVVAARFDETLVAPSTAPPQAAAAPVQTVDGVVVDYSAIGAGSPVPAPETLEQGSTPKLPIRAYEPIDFSGATSGAEGGPFAPVAIYFGHGSAGLSSADRGQIAEIAALQKKRGGGAVRVVGHASSRTNNLPVDAHLLANFDMSMDRANAVANELMRKGVAASDLVIEAVGDRSPEYYESMPAGEAGNRRAEIFLE